MAFYKNCICGKKVYAERRIDFPDLCPYCKRKLVGVSSQSDDVLCGDDNTQRNPESNLQDNEEKLISEKKENHKKEYILRLSNGKEIEIPEEGCIIGRTETGAEDLAEFPSVSRQHLRVTPKRNIGVLIEDISTYGTFVDGRKIEKYTPERVTAGAKVTLCNLDTILLEKDVNGS